MSQGQISTKEIIDTSLAQDLTTREGFRTYLKNGPDRPQSNLRRMHRERAGIISGRASHIWEAMVRRAEELVDTSPETKELVHDAFPNLGSSGYTIGLKVADIDLDDAADYRTFSKAEIEDRSSRTTIPCDTCRRLELE